MTKQGHDVFLSHSRADKSLTEAVARRLRKAGLRPWLDKWNLVPGEAWQEAIEDALTGCSSCAILLGPSGAGPWQNEEMRAAINRRVTTSGTFRVIPVLLPGAKEDSLTCLPSFLAATTWVAFRETIHDDDAFQRLVCGIRGVAPGPDPAKTVGRTQWKLTLNARLEDLDKATIDSIVERLRSISGEINLTLKMVDRGSVVLTIEGSVNAFKRLASLIAAGDLRSLVGFEIQTLQAGDTTLRPPIPGQHLIDAILFVNPSEHAYSRFRQAVPAGINLHHVATCKEALRFVDIRRPSIIVVEQTLPDGDWKDVLKGIYAFESPPHVIVSSRLADEHLWAEALNLGAYDVLLEPFEHSEVELIIKQAIRVAEYQRNRTSAIAVTRAKLG